MRCLLLLSLLVAPLTAADDIYGIPLKADPPFAIDGELGDWAEVPNPLVLNQAAQVIHGAGGWAGPTDLSAIGHLSWRSDGLYVGVAVTDDIHGQNQRGDSIWKGDHIELFLDVQPDLEPTRRDFGVGQFQLAFSPGSLAITGDPLRDAPAEAYVFRPRVIAADGVRVASRQTATGYELEALVPWVLLGVERPREGMVLRYELAVSDTDSVEPRQESMITSSTADWAINRRRLRDAALAPTTGVAQPEARVVPIRAEEVRLQPEGIEQLSFPLPELPEGRLAVLAFNARLDTPKVSGHTNALRIWVNGTAVKGELALNKPQRARARGGDVYSLYSGDIFRVYYSPDFTSADRDPHYGLLDGVPANRFELDITSLVKVGENELKLEFASDKIERELVVADLRLEYQVPPPPEKEKAGPPTGLLEVREPRAEPRTAYQLQQLDDGKLQVTVGGQTFEIANRYSTPAPGWVTGGNDYFDHQLSLDQRPEAIVVTETFTNKTGENLGVMQRHEVAGPLTPVYVAGLERLQGTGATLSPANPTVFGARGDAGIGLLPLNDVFRLHITSYAADRSIGIADNELVIPPGETTTAVWAIVPTEAPTYWRFINAARRLVEANFTIPGGFAFMRVHPKLTGTWTDQQTEDFIRFKDALYVSASLPYVGGWAGHGTAFQQIDRQAFRDAFERRRRLVPGIENQVYFHCFLDISEDGPEKFKEARTLRPDGTQADYGQERYKLYLPRADNSYGPEVAKNIDIILDEIGAEGVYWDEHEYSAYQYHYGDPWDRVSGDIDSRTMKVSRLKSSVTLITEDWRVALAKRILAQGSLVGNGVPVTQRMAELKFPCFVETGSITNCVRNHLYTPIALGDHLTERSEKDAYAVMVAALDYGNVYHWYNDMNVIPTHHTLTQYMYPFTPVELHEGYVIGTDRILTNRSGLFGFGDASRHVVHVFNDEGVEVPDFAAPTVTRDGRTYTELRIAEDWSAAILKQ